MKRLAPNPKRQCNAGQEQADRDVVFLVWFNGTCGRPNLHILCEPKRGWTAPYKGLLMHYENEVTFELQEKNGTKEVWGAKLFYGVL